MSAPAPLPALRPAAQSSFLHRLKYYAFGLAIGCVLTGLLISARYRAAQAQRAQQAAEQAAAGQPADPPPAAP